MSSSNASILERDDLIQQHPPERGERTKKSVVLYAGCCCCTCSCCLHTLGGVIGAASVGDYRRELDKFGDPRNRTRRLPSSQWIFWSSFLAACLASVVIAWLLNPEKISDSLQMIGLSLVMLGPLWLIVASVLSALQIAVRKDLRSTAGYWQQLGRITAGIIVGSLIGTGVMGAIAFVVTLASGR